MKKENKLKKREEERKELIKQREKRFQKQGTICMAVIVGGAVLTPDYAREIGADYYAKDAKQSADIAKAILREAEERP